MADMANPMDALLSYQQALRAGMPFDLNDLDADAYWKRNGEVAGATRFDYVKIIDGEVQALAMFVEEEPHNGTARYSIAYAVSETHRGRGLAVEAINKGIEDLKEKYSRVRVKSFYVEALIDQTNTPSIKVAKQVLSESGFATPDSETDTPALLFYRKFLT